MGQDVVDVVAQPEASRGAIQAAQRRCHHAPSRCSQQWGHAFPAPAAVPGAMHEEKVARTGGSRHCVAWLDSRGYNDSTSRMAIAMLKMRKWRLSVSQRRSVVPKAAQTATLGALTRA